MIYTFGDFRFALCSMLLIYLALQDGHTTRVRFNNVKCKTLDPDFVTFKECRLVVVGRGQIVLNVHARLLKLPVTNASINLELFKRANGYKPFLYNYTRDFCQFMKNQNKVPMLKIFFGILAKDTNINHTCPYHNDIIVRNLLLSDSYFKYMPLPNGDYLFRLSVAAYNDWKAEVRVYIEREE